MLLLILFLVKTFSSSTLRFACTMMILILYYRENTIRTNMFCTFFLTISAPLLSFVQMGWKRSGSSCRQSSAMKISSSGWPAKTTRNSNHPSYHREQEKSMMTMSRSRLRERYSHFEIYLLSFSDTETLFHFWTFQS